MKRVVIDYINWKGERSVRTIMPEKVFFAATEHHKTPQWILSAFDVEKKAWRHFAMADIKSWRQEAETEEP